MPQDRRRLPPKGRAAAGAGGWHGGGGAASSDRPQTPTAKTLTPPEASTENHDVRAAAPRSIKSLGSSSSTSSAYNPSGGLPLGLSSRPGHSREGAARGTRSSRPELVSAFEWEALDIQRRKGLGVQTTSEERGTEAPTDLVDSKEMSRHRPRGPLARDNGLAANEETDMWNKILLDLRKAKEKNDKQKVLAEQIVALNEKIARDGNSKCSFPSSVQVLDPRVLGRCFTCYSHWPFLSPHVPEFYPSSFSFPNSLSPHWAIHLMFHALSDAPGLRIRQVVRIRRCERLHRDIFIYIH